MTSGGRRAGRRALLALPVALMVAGAPPAAGADWGVEQLMQTLRQVKLSKVRFFERKHMAILRTPLEYSGTLVYVAPDRVEKHTLAPRQESLMLQRGELTIESKERNQLRTVALRDYPAIWAFVEGIRSTLAGDLATLRRFYEVRLDGGERSWRLTLRPSDPGMREVVSEIRIGGSGNRINSIEIIESGGDRSVMTITHDAP